MNDFQDGIDRWLAECFPPEAAKDGTERCDRFIEEALELTQACGYGAERAHALVDYVFARPKGDQRQEVGGTMVTLAALCNTFAIDLGFEARRELARISEPQTMAKIRAKQAAKPTGSALPIATTIEAHEALYADRLAKALGENFECRKAATLPDALKMLDVWTPVTFPADAEGKIHFGRAMLEAAADAIRAHLASAASYPEVDRFALLMKRELQANEHKGGWQNDRVEVLAQRTEEEARKLSMAANLLLDDGIRNMEANRASVVREAADTANMAMMVADVVGGLREPLASIGEQP